MNSEIVVELERLKIAELGAERDYHEAMKRGDMPEARRAAEAWINAADALTEYVAKHPDLYRDKG